MIADAEVEVGATADALTLAGILRSEQDALDAFIQMLEAEQSILIEGDAERLAALVPQKSAQIELLNGLGLRRKRHLAASTLHDNTSDMQSWIERHRNVAGPVPQLWEDLRSCARTAQQINTSNGTLIESRMQHNRLKLAVLQNAGAAGNVYRPDGLYDPRQGPRLLGEG